MNRTVDVVEVKLPPKPEYVGVARLTISGIANRMGFAFEEIEDMKIAVSEAITNAVQHAYKKNEDGMIDLKFHIYPEKLEIVVSDQGDRFNVDLLKQKSKPYQHNEPVEYMREGGLGLFLIESLMDKVEIYHENGLVVLMTKFLEREQVERDAKTISTP